MTDVKFSDKRMKDLLQKIVDAYKIFGKWFDTIFYSKINIL